MGELSERKKLILAAVVDRYPTECKSCVKGVKRGFVDKSTVAKQGGKGGAVGVLFVKACENGKDIFQGFCGSVVECKGDKFPIAVDGGNIGVGRVPNAVDSNRFAWDIAFHFRGVELGRGNGV